ncbi:MAG: ATP-binding cassette domain-containing protein, partial [Oscillospiraceae bacterium]|nr:ATP-binding cassette domain-containing protein [Oscillospiraceae bacterium]
MSEQLALELKGIWKAFSGNVVLKNANFGLKKGEIHALVGENGAGKSTMMNITFGIVPADEGEIWIDGVEHQVPNPRIAQDLGIGFVHQEIALCPDLTVTENIFMSEIKDKTKLNIGYKNLRKRAMELLEPLAPIDPDAIVERLSVSDQQTVEIAKALSRECKVLIMDEPTAALSAKESEALFEIMHNLKN